MSNRIRDMQESIKALRKIVDGLKREWVEGDEFEAHKEILDNYVGYLESDWRSLLLEIAQKK